MTPEVKALLEACKSARETIAREHPCYEGLLDKLNNAIAGVEQPNLSIAELTVLRKLDEAILAGSSCIGFIVQRDSIDWNRLEAARSLVQKGLLVEAEDRVFRRAP